MKVLEQSRVKVRSVSSNVALNGLHTQLVFFPKILCLSDLHTQCGAPAHKPEMQRCVPRWSAGRPATDSLR